MEHRWASQITLYLTAGAAISIGVAWACELVFRFEPSSWRYEWAHAEDTFIATSHRAIGRRSHTVSSLSDPSGQQPGGHPIPRDAVPGNVRDRLPGWVRIPADRRGVGGHEEIATVGAGLPLICLVHRHASASVETERGWQTSEHAAGVITIPTPWTRSGHTQLSWRPHAQGLAVNAAIWGFGLRVGLGVLGAAQARLRGRRGGCQRCGYDLSGQTSESACPECGDADRGGSTFARA